MNLEKHKILMWIFGLGGFISILNFYLSFIRYPLHCLLSLKDDYKNISGYPMLGTVLNVISIIGFWGTKMALLATVFLFIDTGGFLWFAYSMLVQQLKRNKNNQSSQ